MYMYTICMFHQCILNRLAKLHHVRHAGARRFRPVFRWRPGPRHGGRDGAWELWSAGRGGGPGGVRPKYFWKLNNFRSFSSELNIFWFKTLDEWFKHCSMHLVWWLLALIWLLSNGSQCPKGNHGDKLPELWTIAHDCDLLLIQPFFGRLPDM